MINKEMSTIKNLISNNQISYTKSYLKISNLLLNNKFLFQHVYDMEPCPVTYELSDWHKSPNGDPEWLYVLNRQEYLQDLMVAFLNTDEFKYLEKAKYFMFEWIKNNYDNKEFRYSAWRTIDTGIRLLNWSSIYKLLISKNLITEKDVEKLHIVIKDQAKYLYDNYVDKYDLSNWGVLITTGILCFDAVNPHIIDAQLVKWALDKLQVELELQVDDDGIHWEQSPLYFIEVFRSSLCVYAAYKNSQLSIPPVIEMKLNLMLNALNYLVKPNGYIVQQGDTDSIRVNDLIASANLILKSELSNEQYDLVPIEFYSFNNLKMEPSKNPNCAVNFDANISGNYYLKDKNKNYWHLFSGNLGSGHGHVSLGHLDLMIEGQEILIDPGRLTYINTDERRYLKSGASHNIISVDNMYPIEPKDSWKFSKETTSNRNYVNHSNKFDVVVSGYSNLETQLHYTRYFLWIKEYNIAAIFDVGSQAGKHLKQNNWIISPDLTAENVEGSCVTLTDKNQKEYVIYNSDSEIRGVDQLYSPRYNVKEKTLKIEASSKFENNFVSYTIIGSKDNIKNVKKLVSKHKSPVDSIENIQCYPIEIELNNGKSITIVLQHENTIVGDKVYYVNGIPFYGTLSLISNSKFLRLL